MPAIAGIIATPGTPAGDSIDTMLQRMGAGLASSTGRCSIAPLGATLGWVSQQDHPANPTIVWNRESTVCLLFTGEDFSGTNPGTRPSTGSREADVAALLDRYQSSERQFLRDLNGQFSGVLVDLRRNCLTIFNDRYGLGRLYYHESRDGFHFASEAKALLAAHPALRTLDQRGLAEYVALGCVLQNRTIFPGMHLLPPASAWTFSASGAVRKEKYFDPAEWEQQDLLAPDEYRAQLRDVFARATARQLRGGASVALSLTGGLDSRAVIAWAGVEPGTLPCYTFAGPYRNCADVTIARRLASLCNHPHTTIRVSDEFFEDFDVLAEKAIHVSDGTMDVSGAVELHVNRIASGIAPVRLTGNYGSEILRLNVVLKPRKTDTTAFTPEFARLLEEASLTCAEESRCHRLSFIAFKQMPWHHYARRTMERAEIVPRSPFLDNELVALAYRAPVDRRTSAQTLLELIADGNASLASVATDRALRVGGSRVMTGVAARWQEFTVKAEYAYDYGMPTWLAQTDRMLTRLHLERLFLGRHKFYHFRIWYRDALSRYVRQHALERSSQPACYRAGAVSRMAESHLSGRGNHTLGLHTALTLELIEDLLVHQH